VLSVLVLCHGALSAVWTRRIILPSRRNEAALFFRYQQTISRRARKTSPTIAKKTSNCGSISIGPFSLSSKGAAHVKATGLVYRHSHSE
jgi:hypothetical protein